MADDKLIQQVEEFEKNQDSGKKPDKKSGIKYALNISFVLIATVLAIYLSIKDNTRAIIDNLKTCDIHWLLVAIGLAAIMVFIRSLILYFFARLYSRDYKFHQALAVDQIGVFYNAVTPGASGGQIMQAYTYKKQGVHISSAVSIMAMYSIVFQSVLIIFGLVSFVVKYDFLISMESFNSGIIIGGVPLNIPIWPLTIIGFLLNVGVILIVLLMGYWHGFHNFVMGPVISLLAKLKMVKNPDKSRESLRIQVENFKIEFRRLLTNVRFTILITVIFTFYLCVKFSIPYFVGLAMHNQSTVASFWDSIFLSNYHQMVTGLIPVPGSAGVSELFFYQLFVNTKTPEAGFFYATSATLTDSEASIALCRSALLIWRTSTFAVPILVAGFVAAFYRSSPKNEAHINGDLPNRETFVNLQNETLVQRKEEVESAEYTSKLSRAAVYRMLRSSTQKKLKRPNEEDIEEFDNLDINIDEDDE